MSIGEFKKQIEHWLKRVTVECPPSSAEMLSCIRVITALELKIDEARKEFPLINCNSDASDEYLERLSKWRKKWFGSKEVKP